MTNNNSKIKKAPAPQVQISDVFFMTLRRWPWILLSLAVCVGAAMFYLMRTAPVYTRSASILIKNDSKGKSMSTELDAFADMGLIQTNTNLNDEVNKLQSPDIIGEVVKRLNLDVTYMVDGKFHKEVIYGSQLPVNVSFPGASESESLTVDVKVGKNGEIALDNLTRNGEEMKLNRDNGIVFGDTVQSAAGPIVVSKTPFFTDGEKYDIYVSKAPMRATIAAFAGELGVTVKNDKGNTIVLTVSDHSTQRAEDLLNALIAVYNENWIKTRNQISISTSNFINERLGVIEQELGSVDQDISSFKSEHQIPDVTQAASMYMSENQQASAQLLDLNNQLQMARYIRNYVTDPENRHQFMPVNSGIGSSNIESQISEYNEVVAQRNKYAANSSASNPVVENLDSQLEGMRTAIIQSVDNEIVALNTSIKNIQTSKRNATAQIAANPSQARYLLSVERQQKVKESLYLFLLQKREENELSQAFTAYNTEVITAPNGSNMPTAPNRRNVLMCAVLLGLFIPFGYTYIRETNNTKVRGRKDVEDLSVPFLGEIPLYGQPTTAKDKTGSEGSMVVKSGKRDIINEAFRVLRTNLEFMNVGSEGGNVIAVTSFNPGSGKSFLTLNIGMSLAIKGRKVLIIDGDMRHGSTSKFVNSPRLGLSNYLVGSETDLGKLIVTDKDTPTLSILPVGPMPPNPTELLETPMFRQLIEKVKPMYDYVLIDCPPIEVVADTQIIDKVVDRTVFVLRAGLFERGMLPELEKIYDDKKYRNMAFILNGTNNGEGRYGYSHAYRYGYGYGYGYGYHYGGDDKKKK